MDHDLHFIRTRKRSVCWGVEGSCRCTKDGVLPLVEDGRVVKILVSASWTHAEPWLEEWDGRLQWWPFHMALTLSRNSVLSIKENVEETHISVPTLQRLTLQVEILQLDWLQGPLWEATIGEGGEQATPGPGSSHLPAHKRCHEPSQGTQTEFSRNVNPKSKCSTFSNPGCKIKWADDLNKCFLKEELQLPKKYMTKKLNIFSH
jgi:hypothetical protein